MKYWVAYRDCPDCVEAYMLDTLSMPPPGENGEFVQAFVQKGCKTRLSETEPIVGPCAQHREIAPVEGKAASPEEKLMLETGLPLQAEESKGGDMPEQVKVTFETIQDLRTTTKFDEDLGSVRWKFTFEAQIDPSLVATLLKAQASGVPLFAVIGSRQLQMIDPKTGEIA